MLEEGYVIRGINWRQTFPVTNIFRSFRIAFHPSKMVLGLALLLTVYVGGRILDRIWPVHARAVAGEVEQYQQLIGSGDDRHALAQWRDEQQKQIDAAYASELLARGVDKDAAIALQDAQARNKSAELGDAIAKQLTDTVNQTWTDYKAIVAQAEADYAKPTEKSAALRKTRDVIIDQAGKVRNSLLAAAYDQAYQDKTQIKSYLGQGLFISTFEYETHQVSRLARAILHDNWFGEGGVKDSVINLVTVGPVWLITCHPIFFILIALLFLFAWSLFGGAISRIAAVHVARDEKISVRQAVNFSVGKFISFASAPVVPLLIFGLIGLVVAVAGLLTNVNFLGPIIVGAAFILALLAGLLMTIVLLGTLGGINLMYPTIAVEGSDSFDAISRSFSYVYARPWRMFFYSAVALVYGAITYLIVHLFIWLMLVLTHRFAGAGVFVSGNDMRNLFNDMWPNPQAVGRLTYHVNYPALGPGQSVGAFLIQFWVMLLASLLGAFAISLYFSANTIIYYLMRAEVDATEMDDVYLEQGDEEFTEAPPAPAAATSEVIGAVTVAATPASPAPTEPTAPGDALPSA